MVKKLPVLTIQKLIDYLAHSKYPREVSKHYSSTHTHTLTCTHASQMALVIKNSPSNAGDIRDLGLIPGQEDPLEEGMATHSRILGWRIPWTEEPGGL